MPVTMEQVIAALSREEPNYPEAAKLGPGALPHLGKLVESMDPLLASKAAYLAGLIQDPGNVGVLERAARSPNAAVRVSAAATARNLPAARASEILLNLVHDQDGGVRRLALKSVPPDAAPKLRRKIEAMGEVEPDPELRRLSNEVLRRLR